MGFPGYNAIMPGRREVRGEDHAENGYVNYALGQVGPHTALRGVPGRPVRPLAERRGLPARLHVHGGRRHQLCPVMWNDHAPVEPYRESTITSTRTSRTRPSTGSPGTSRSSPRPPFMMSGHRARCTHRIKRPRSTSTSTRASSTWAGTRRGDDPERQKQLGIVPPGHQAHRAHRRDPRLGFAE